MIQTFFTARRVLSAVWLLLASLCTLTPANAQLDSGTFQILQGGVVVGLIYVPERGPDPSIYAEYWVLSSHYTYPGVKTMVTTQIVPLATNPYTSLQNFLAKAPWAEGYRFVTVAAKDSELLPAVNSTVGSPAGN
jgi:hypothetical protein